MIPIIASLGGSIISGVSGFFQRKQEIKKSSQTAKAKLEMARVNNSHEAVLNEQEIEALAVKDLTNSWKDEYVTILVLLPIPLIFIGAIYGAITGDMTLLNGITNAIDKLTALGIDWNYIMGPVILSAIGYRVFRR